MHEMIAAAKAGETAKAVAINNRLLGLHRTLFVESNPIPVKWALHRMGRIAEGLRLPLTPLSSQHHETVAAALRAAGCLS
jgi:4-hydroxy-tetrahydrodipicolinate synthase